MAPLKVGDRVQVEVPWSALFGEAGTVTQVEPCVMVLFDFDDSEGPVRIAAESLGPEPA